MYVGVSLKAPDEGEWTALTRVTADGETRSRGYENGRLFTERDVVLLVNAATGENLDETLDLDVLIEMARRDGSRFDFEERDR